MTSGSDRQFREASVHGRFQPFHNGHLEYVRAAAVRCEFLWVGITQHTSKRLVQVDVADALHRAEPQSNPLTYFERLQTIRAALASIGLNHDGYAVVPFPIEEPNLVVEFLPTTVPVFTTTYDEWNEAKIATLRGIGYEVINLWSRQIKEVAGHELRDMIRRGDSAWRAQVPPGVASLIDEFDLAGRLQALTHEAP